jgi:hypothetical protein
MAKSKRVRWECPWPGIDMPSNEGDIYDMDAAMISASERLREGSAA